MQKVNSEDSESTIEPETLSVEVQLNISYCYFWSSFLFDGYAHIGARLKGPQNQQVAKITFRMEPKVEEICWVWRVEVQH